MDILEIALRVFDEIESEVKHTSKWSENSKYVRIRKLQIDGVIAKIAVIARERNRGSNPIQ